MIIIIKLLYILLASRKLSIRFISWIKSTLFYTVFSYILMLIINNNKNGKKRAKKD